MLVLVFIFPDYIRSIPKAMALMVESLQEIPEDIPVSLISLLFYIQVSLKLITVQYQYLFKTFVYQKALIPTFNTSF